MHAVKSGWPLNGSMQSKIVLTMLAMISEIERDLNLNTRLRARKAAGVKLGRPEGPGKSKFDPHKDETFALYNIGISQNFCG